MSGFDPFAAFGGGGGSSSSTGLGRGEEGPSEADKLIEAEQKRTERQRIEQIQRQLTLETSSRGRGYGLRSLFGSLGSGRSSLLGAG